MFEFKIKGGRRVGGDELMLTTLAGLSFYNNLEFRRNPV